MVEERVQRRLAAILAADVVGYSRLMAADEAGTLAALKAHRKEFMAPKTAEYGGRIVKLMGDGALVEFASVVDAVECAVAMQRGMGERNAGIPEDLRIVFRIGINLGDIIIDGNDIYGDGVNVAARLEDLAEPGGICISRTVFNHIKGKVQLSFEDLGEHEVKNIVQPVHVFSVNLGTAKESTERGEGSAVSTLDLSDKPSIAVLPFANLSNDPEQEYFADGMAEDIITALSQLRQWFVIARNSSFTYKGRNVDIRQVAKELGVRYVLEGSVRKSGNRVRISGQLIDATTGNHLWADRFDGDLEDIFDLQDKVTERVVGAMQPTLRKAEIERSRRKPPDSLDAYDLYLRALPHAYAMQPDENAQALTLLHKAIEIDPAYAPALAYAAWAYENRVTRGWAPYGEDDAGAAVALARRAIAADKDDALVLAAAGLVLVMVARDYNNGLQAAERALGLNPNMALVSFWVGVSKLFGGDPEEAILCFENAIRVSPADPNAFFFFTAAGLGHLFCGRPLEAYEMAKKSIYGGWDSTYWVLAPALAQLGRMEEARAAVSKLRELAPNATISLYRELMPIRNKVTLENFLDSMSKAGLPD